MREAYLYRDYVIKAFSDDLPYDQFLREQVAGDLLARDDPGVRYAEQVAATGFIAQSRRFGYDPQNYQHLTIQDTIDTVGQATMGLSLGCARCHHHKYDPITSGDYYGLYGIFASTRYAFPGSEEKHSPSDFVPMLPPEEATAKKRAYDETLAWLDASIKAADPALFAAEIAELKQARAAMVSDGPYPVAYAVVEGTAQDSKIQKRGEPTLPGDVAPRRFLEILGGDPVPGDGGSGRKRWPIGSRGHRIRSRPA